ncbi:MAG: Rrf2 family transcriptional regulator [Saprospiraceae bacterium]|jgi:Rrf2 family iron-sulfur cluster assembly transcriptional regulator|nr:Rrf2 family transcriptional regulator [Saprospiraceae bacterium]
MSLRIFSNSSVYALRALMYLVSRREKQKYISIKEMSETLDISFHFLTKALQPLTHKGILMSSRGPAGGVSFLKAPEEVTLMEIILILEGEDFFKSCMLGLEGCGHQRPCPVHGVWMDIKSILMKEFSSISLAMIGDKTVMQHLRLMNL